MLKQALIGSFIIILLGSCSALKQLQFSDNKQESQTPGAKGKNEVKFLEDINVNVESGPLAKESQKTGEKKNPDLVFANNSSVSESPFIEKSSSLQLRYSLLLNTEVEKI